MSRLEPLPRKRLLPLIDFKSKSLVLYGHVKENATVKSRIREDIERFGLEIDSKLRSEYRSTLPRIPLHMLHTHWCNRRKGECTCKLLNFSAPGALLVRIEALPEKIGSQMALSRMLNNHGENKIMIAIREMHDAQSDQFDSLKQMRKTFVFPVLDTQWNHGNGVCAMMSSLDTKIPESESESEETLPKAPKTNSSIFYDIANLTMNTQVPKSKFAPKQAKTSPKPVRKQTVKPKRRKNTAIKDMLLHERLNYAEPEHLSAIRKPSVILQPDIQRQTLLAIDDKIQALLTADEAATIHVVGMDRVKIDMNADLLDREQDENISAKLEVAEGFTRASTFNLSLNNALLMPVIQEGMLLAVKPQDELELITINEMLDAEGDYVEEPDYDE